MRTLVEGGNYSVQYEDGSFYTASASLTCIKSDIRHRISTNLHTDGLVTIRRSCYTINLSDQTYDIRNASRSPSRCLSRPCPVTFSTLGCGVPATLLALFTNAKPRETGQVSGMNGRAVMETCCYLRVGECCRGLTAFTP